MIELIVEAHVAITLIQVLRILTFIVLQIIEDVLL
jgi:hypothetical protein